MLRLFRFIPVVKDTIRIRDIRGFVESDPSLDDISKFISIMKTYKLHHNVDGDDIDDIEFNIAFPHLNDFHLCLLTNTDIMKLDLPPTDYQRVKYGVVPMDDFLRAELGYYDPVQSIDRLSEILVDFDAQLQRVMRTREQNAFQRVFRPYAFSLKNMVKSLAEYHFDMSFEEV